MSSELFLHDYENFAELLAAVAAQSNIPLQLLEKDYWLMHVLWGLQNAGLRYELKGGTSLSKGWNIINRFSEDVDIKIFAPEGMIVHASKNHTKPRHRDSRAKYFEWLLENLKVPGVAYLKRDSDFDDRDLRNAGYRVGYTSKYEAYGGLKTDVLLEVGFDTTTPNLALDISSWVYDAAVKGGLNVRDNRAKAVPCYLPEYTFIEKLSAISKKYRQELEGKDVKNFTRHYYDIFQLLAEPRVQSFIGTPEYRDHKAARFGKNENPDIKTNPAFTLPDPEIRTKYTERYARSAGLYFRGQPSLDQIMGRIAEVIDKL